MTSTNRQSSTAATPISFDCSSDACAPSCGATCGSSCACNDCCGGSILGECCLGEKFDLGEQLFCPDSGWDLGGWSQIGYHSSNDGVFNTHPGSLDLQQGYMFLEKIADGKCGVGFGGRVDVMYGTDGSNTQSFGNNPGNFDFQNDFDHGIYGWALPQMYGEVAYENLSVKLGHFYTLMGYQVVPATGNFFYSIPYTFNFSEAFTHTGALATYKAHDNLTVYGGWTLGWDTGFDQVNQGNSFLGGASFKATDDVTATYICTAGNLGWIGNGYAHSFVIDWVVNDKWEYVIQSDLNSIDNSVNAQGGHYDTIGLNQYMFYTVNDCLKVGGRNEWWKADGVSFYESAFGLNIRPRANLLLRPELRYNWQPGNAVPGVLPVASTLNRTTIEDYRENAIFGMDAIFSF
ncbi:MAG: outer membrane beta-barrel protein [Planctomycetota bacterium]|nr:outer membrane beta-barrel protein [Planctomycetota bacterium]MDA1180421.1 outer membrane beta-barrel protein [Planctomycetota bacterium]